jgi:hypothetical protein
MQTAALSRSVRTDGGTYLDTYVPLSQMPSGEPAWFLVAAVLGAEACTVELAPVIRPGVETLARERLLDSTVGLARDRPRGPTRGLALAGSQTVPLFELAGIPQLQVGLLFTGMAGDDRPAAFEFGVELSAQQDGDIGDPQPHQEDDHGGQ